MIFPDYGNTEQSTGDALLWTVDRGLWTALPAEALAKEGGLLARRSFSEGGSTVDFTHPT